MIKWRRKGEEIQNSSVREGGRKFTIVTTGDSELTVSRLVVAQVSGRTNYYVELPLIQSLKSQELSS